MKMQKLIETSAKLRMYITKNLAKRHPPVVPEDYPSDWKSIYIATLLSVLSMLQSSCIGPTIWPYMQRLVPTSTQTEYSVMVSITNASSAVSSIIFGFLSNHFGQTTGPLIFSKITMLLGSGVYLFVNVTMGARMFMFYVAQLLFGISGGAGSVAKTQIVMASTETDRSKAMGITGVGSLAGLILGPILQISFLGIGYPGVDFLFGTRLNLFTVPILVTMGVSIIGILLLTFLFDGKMRVRKKEAAFERVHSVTYNKSESKQTLEISKESISTISDDTEQVQYDKIAAIICICTNTLVGLMMMILSIIIPPFAMMVFEWTSEDMVLYQSIGMVVVGVCMMIVIGSYVFFRLGQKIAPRVGVIFSLVIFFIFHLLTFTWPFFGSHIPYKHPKGVDPANFTCADLASVNSSVQLVGCPCEYTCILALGIAIPIIQINLDTLYSKILGPMKQGTMQGVYVACNITIQIIAPIIISEVYAASGIIYIWIFIMIVIVFFCLIWVIFYRRMISYMDRQENLKSCIRPSGISKIFY